MIPPGNRRARRLSIGAAALASSLALAGCALAGCKGRATEGEASTAPSASGAAAPLPVDRVLPGELGEGAESVFGLTLPRGFRVVSRFGDQAIAEGPSQPEATANYVRRRVVASIEEIGASRTIFQGAKAKSSPDAPFVRVEVVQVASGTQIVLRDLSPVPVEPGLTEEQRWKKAGLKPNGELLDPSHTF